MQKIGRNDTCPCGSGKKYKNCCLAKLQPSSDELAWHRIKNMHQMLIRKLMEFTSKAYGATGYNEAWDEFHLWTNDEPFDPESPFHPMFGPWMFYHWSPDPTETELSSEIPVEITPAEHFKDKFRNRLEALELEDLEESLRRPFSFFDVLECSPGAWVKVQDLLTEEYFTVIEKMGTRSMKVGDLLFGKVVTVRGVCMFDGLAPLVLPTQAKLRIIQERVKFQRQLKQITPDILREFDLELIGIFWELYEAIINPPPPILTNTDGHLMVPHKMTFSIESIDDVFDALHDLNFNCTREELISRAELFENGKLKSVEFAWLMKGNKKNKHWENTVLGHIQIEGGKMIVDVNSKERSKKFLTLLKKRMSKGWVLMETAVEDLQSKLQSQLSETLDKDQDEDKKLRELQEDPEIKKLMAKMNEGHWLNWPTTPLPALNGKTPLAAMKSNAGRDMVDALITDFERHAERKPLPGQTVETFQKLRERLGL